MYEGVPLALPPLPFKAEAAVATTTSAGYMVSGPAATLSREGIITIEGVSRDFLVDDSLTFTPFEIAFTTADGWHVTAHRCLVNVREFPSGAFIVYAATLEAMRGTIQDRNHVTVYRLVSGLPEGALDGEARRSDKFFTTADLAPLSLVHARPEDVPLIEPAITGYFIVEGSYSSRRDWEDLFGRLYNLLALAASNFVAFPLTHVTGSRGEQVELHSTSRETGRGQSVLYLKYPMALSKFLNSTYDQYVRWRDLLDLDTLIHYYVLLKNTGYAETRILLGSVLMEGVKYAYAEHYKHWPKDKKTGKYIKPDGTAHGVLLDFRSLIKEVYSEFGLKNGNTAFVRYRNGVVHQGRLSSLTWAQARDLAADLEHPIEHLLLCILAYQGDYWDTTVMDANGRPGAWVDFASVAI